jgi:hypothetical protein
MTSPHSQQSLDNHTSSSRNPIGEEQFEAHLTVPFVKCTLGSRVKYLRYMSTPDSSWKDIWYSGTLIHWANSPDGTMALVKPDQYNGHRGLELVEPTLMRFE